MIKARSCRRETRDNKVMNEKLCELARSGLEVGLMVANENGGNGAGQEEACGAQRVARQGHKHGAGGRGPLLLSGYRGAAAPR